jgi:hypothetical protein
VLFRSLRRLTALSVVAADRLVALNDPFCPSTTCENSFNPRLELVIAWIQAIMFYIWLSVPPELHIW